MHDAGDNIPIFNEVLAEGRCVAEVEVPTVDFGRESREVQVVCTPCGPEVDLYPGSGRLNTLTHDSASGGQGSGLYRRRGPSHTGQ